jgi:GxxExxY protein
LLIANPVAMAAYADSDLTHTVIGGFYEVFRELGHGYAEKIYRRALAIVLHEHGLEALQEAPLTVNFHGQQIGTFWVDILVNQCLYVEVKAAADIEPYATAQLLNYLKCVGGGVGLLVNFGNELKFRRYIVGLPPKNDAAAVEEH